MLQRNDHKTIRPVLLGMVVKQFMAASLLRILSCMGSQQALSSTIFQHG
jgi:hypothetical protein